MSVYRPLPEEEASDLASRILYEDNHLLVLDKRPGEIVQADKTGDECLLETLKAFIAQRDSKPGNVFLGLPHRLDRPVGGVVLFAKTSKALGRLDAMFRDGEVHKTYWALTCAEPSPSEGLLEGMMWRDASRNKSYICHGGKVRPDAKRCALRYRLLQSTDRYHLVEVELLTGRHHQIRCQLSDAGWPIKGDLKYGAPRSNPDGSICLLAKRISFTHPVGRESVVEVEAPLPQEWTRYGLR